MGASLLIAACQPNYLRCDLERNLSKAEVVSRCGHPYGPDGQRIDPLDYDVWSYFLAEDPASPLRYLYFNGDRLDNWQTIPRDQKSIIKQYERMLRNTRD